MMPLNPEAFKLLNEFPVKYIDIHSVSFYDEKLLEAVKKSGLDVILGVGGRTMEEIVEKQNFFKEKLKVLMVGFQSFPSRIEDVRIGKIAFLKEKFPALRIGYADHSAFDSEYAVKSNEYARILGASIFEKHITTQEGIDRVDFSSAVSMQKIVSIREKISFIDDFIATDFAKSFAFTEAEIIYRERQLRFVSGRELDKGVVLTEEMLSLKLVDDPTETFNKLEDLIGKKTISFIPKDKPIKISDLM
jgi:sialic acid synthase SpsE